MSTNLTIAVNNDSQDQPYNTSGVIWTIVSVGNDYLVFTSGSDTVADGQPIPSSFQLGNAGPFLDNVQIVVPHYLLADISANELKEIFNMGDQNKRYVMAFVFDGATTSEPVLEAWDDTNLNTVNFVSLGNGTPSSSWLKGVTTTNGSSGVAGWPGSTMAGSSDGHFLWLNDQNGALTGAATLYCNLKLVIPNTQIAGGAEAPILTVKYTTT